MGTGVLSPTWKPPSTGGGGGGGGGGSTTTSTTVTKTKLEQAAGVVAHSFGLFDLAASVTAVQAFRTISGSAVTLAQVGIIMPYSGSILGLSYVADTVKTAGSATFTPYVAGTAQLGTLAWTANNSSGVQTFTAGTYVFAAADLVDVRVTTDSSFAGTPSVELILYVTFDATV